MATTTISVTIDPTAFKRSAADIQRASRTITQSMENMKKSCTAANDALNESGAFGRAKAQLKNIEKQASARESTLKGINIDSAAFAKLLKNNPMPKYNAERMIASLRKFPDITIWLNQMSSAAQEIANLEAGLENNRLSTQEWSGEMEKLLGKYREFPDIVTRLNQQLVRLEVEDLSPLLEGKTLDGKPWEGEGKSLDAWGREIEILKEKYKDFSEIVAWLDELLIKQEMRGVGVEFFQHLQGTILKSLISGQSLSELVDSDITGNPVVMELLKKVTEIGFFGEKGVGGIWGGSLNNIFAAFELPRGFLQFLSKQEDMKENLKEFDRLTVGWTDSLKKGLVDSIVEGKNFGEVFRNIGDEIAKTMLRLVLFGKNGDGGWLGGFMNDIVGGLFGFSHGGGFSAGKQINQYERGGVLRFGRDLQKFASGGIVGAPTLFGMRGGLGLMGEAGPEAILPLKRLPNGDLGVTADMSYSQTGGSEQSAPQLIVNVENNTSTPVTGSQTEARWDQQLKSYVVQVLLEDQASNGPITRNYRNAARR